MDAQRRLSGKPKPSETWKPPVNDPSKHHYVPACYLRQWAGDDGRVCEFKRVYGKVVHRRAFPTETGYEKDLYKIEGVSAEDAQSVEKGFLSLLDSDAGSLLQRIVRGVRTEWTDKERSVWASFILSLRFRNPQAVALIKRNVREVSQAALDYYRENYDRYRDPNDPPTFEEFVSAIKPETPHLTAASMFCEIVANQRIGDTLVNMHWSRLHLPGSAYSFLTSDRPVVTSGGLASKDVAIIVPVGPKKLVVGAHNEEWAKRIYTAAPSKVVQEINKHIVEIARTYVWGTDASQLRFVTNRIARQPDIPIITDEQFRQSVEDARTGVYAEEQRRIDTAARASAAAMSFVT